MLIKNYEKGINLVLLFIGTLVLSQNRTSDFGLLGKVESLQSITTSYNNPNQNVVSGFLDSEQFDSIYLKFDRRRNLILKENFLDYRGRLGIFDRTTYAYNPQNQIEKLETTLIQNGEEPRKISQRKIYYYLKNQQIRMDEFNFGRTTDQFWVMNSIYEEGNLKEKVFWMEDKIFSRTKYEFDWNNNPVSEKTFHNNGKGGKAIHYENNKSGLPVKLTTSSGRLKIIDTYSYGPHYVSQHLKMDETGKVIFSETFSENGMISVIKKVNHVSGLQDIYGFKFEFDNSNNWISCEISKNSSPVYLINRKIKYYK